MAMEIPLTQGLVAIVDDEDYALASQFKWYAAANRKHWYAIRSIRRDGRKLTIKLHHFLLGEMREGLVVDHINRNGLDNRRSNLRWVTPQQNAMNRRDARGTSVYRGVYRRPWGWCANFRVNGKATYLGTFPTELQAAMAWDAVARKSYGEYAALNFPDGGDGDGAAT